MSITTQAYCNACKKNASFVYDGEDWQCQSCGCCNAQSGIVDMESLNDNDTCDKM